MRRITGRKRLAARRQATATSLVVVALLACTDYPTQSVGELTNRYRLTITVTNVGTGIGRATVSFAAGSAQNPCTEVLGPGMSCSPYVVSPIAPESAELHVSAEPGSEFVGWTGAYCTGAENDCTVHSATKDFDVEIGVEARFDLVGGQ